MMTFIVVYPSKKQNIILKRINRSKAVLANIFFVVFNYLSFAQLFRFTLLFFELYSGSARDISSTKVFKYL